MRRGVKRALCDGRDEEMCDEERREKGSVRWV
jgi:hypothetical protein